MSWVSLSCGCTLEVGRASPVHDPRTHDRRALSAESSADVDALAAPPEWPEAVVWSEQGGAADGVLALDATDDSERDLVLLGRGSEVGRLSRGLGQGRFDAATPLRDDRLGAVRHSTMRIDANGDGRDDLVYASSLTDNHEPRRARLTTLLNQGDGTFIPRVSELPGYAGPTAAADLDGDGQAELIVAYGRSNQEPSARTYLDVLEGDGSGGFVEGRFHVRIDGVGPTQLLATRLRSAERHELVVLGPGDDGTSRLWVLPISDVGLPDEGDAVAVPTPGFAPERILSADLDADGREELVLASEQGQRLMLISFTLLETSTLVPIVREVSLAAESYALTAQLDVADFDDDGYLDLALPGSDTRSEGGFALGPCVVIAYGDAELSFARRRVLQVAASAHEFGAHVVASDLDESARPDILLLTHGSSGQPSRSAVLFDPG